MSFTYKYPRPSLTVDCVLFGWNGKELKILLIQRLGEPFRDRWALPGGFVHIDEDIEDAARRELEEETGLKDIFLEQLYTFGKPGRDPRGRVVSVAWFALINIAGHEHPVAASDAKSANWFSLELLPELAFDHNEILETAVRRLRAKVKYQPVGFELMPEKFTLPELQLLYEKILGEELDKRNFRKKLMSMDVLVELDEYEENVDRRPGRYYVFDKEKYMKLEKVGFRFSL